VGRELLLQVGVLDAVEIGLIVALHRLALRPGLEAPVVDLVDELPEPLLLAPVSEGEPQPQPLAPGRVRVLADMDPLCAADELGDVTAGPGQRLGDLHAAGAATDDTPAPARIG